MHKKSIKKRKTVFLLKTNKNTIKKSVQKYLQQIAQLFTTYETQFNEEQLEEMDKIFLGNVPKQVLLTLQDVGRIRNNKIKIDVVEPQEYNTIICLHHKHMMFEKKDAPYGLFYPSSKMNKTYACSGSGCDHWWVVGRPLQSYLRNVVKRLQHYIQTCV